MDCHCGHFSEKWGSDGFRQLLRLPNGKITLVTPALLFQIQWTKLKTHPICLVMFPLLFVPFLPCLFSSPDEDPAKGICEVHAPIFICPEPSRPLAHKGGGVQRIVLFGNE